MPPRVPACTSDDEHLRRTGSVNGHHQIRVLFMHLHLDHATGTARSSVGAKPSVTTIAAIATIATTTMSVQRV